MQKSTDFQEFQFSTNSSYNILKKIGSGRTGIAYLAKRSSGGVQDYLTCKIIKEINEHQLLQLQRDMNVAVQLRHENIVKLYGLEYLPKNIFSPSIVETLQKTECDDQENSLDIQRLNLHRRKNQTLRFIKNLHQPKPYIWIIVTDYIDGINLKNLHQKHIHMGLLIPVKLAMFIISQIARGLFYAHHFLLHKNIRPNNIHITTQGGCKLNDFWTSALGLQNTEYSSPEQWFQEELAEESDIFSLGCIAYEILTGISPMKSFLHSDKTLITFANIINETVPPHLLCQDIPEEVSHLIMQMLILHPRRRCSKLTTVSNHLDKKYLYYDGYGPTNNSLAAYLTILENKFLIYNEENLSQLQFLKNMKDEIQLQRKLEEVYTPKGFAWLQEKKITNLSSFIQEKKAGFPHFFTKKFPYIKVKYLDNVIASYKIDGHKLKIGSEGCHISLKDDHIKKKHCLIQLHNKQVLLKSLQDNNEIFVNNQLCQQKYLKEGDRIKVGEYTMYLLQQTENIPSHLPTVFDSQIENNEIFLQKNNLSLIFPTDQKTLSKLVHFLEIMLNHTRISKEKIALIPTGIIEIIQILRNPTDNAQLQLDIHKTPICFLYTFSRFLEKSYQNLLYMFQQYRQILTKKNRERELNFPEQEDNDLLGDVLTSKINNVPSQEEIRSELSEIDSELLYIATTLIVKSFDRIELNHSQQTVQLSVYL
ncbi:MAG TPA: protein kinase [Planctomycetota bacterium]|nr:protein kinase [Planctomycetota bacterium]